MQKLKILIKKSLLNSKLDTPYSTTLFNGIFNAHMMCNVEVKNEKI